MIYLGLDSCKRGWVVVAIQEFGFVEAFVAPTVAAAIEGAHGFGTIAATVVDIPIGIPDAGPRQADVLARRFIQPRGASVFPTPVRAALSATTYAEAAAASIRLQGKSLSSQAYAIREKILDADGYVRDSAAPIHEGHPEVSFRLMASEGIVHPKKSFAGMTLRHTLLAGEGIEIPFGIENTLAGAGADDVLDAAAMAWTARRIARGEADRFPPADQAERFSDDIDSAIWY